MKIDEISAIVQECEFPGYTFGVAQSHTGAIYLQAVYDETDTVKGTVEPQFTRRWFLSPEMVKSEIVATCFKCILTSMEHKAREWFTYRNRPIYHPHHDVDQLHAICEERDVRLAVTA
jgi:hypothetical protein